MQPCPHRWRKRLYDGALIALMAVGLVGAFAGHLYEPYRDIVHAVLFGLAVVYFSLRAIPPVNKWFGFDVHAPRTDERDHLIRLRADARTLNILSYVVAASVIFFSLAPPTLRDPNVLATFLMMLWLSMNWLPVLVKDRLNARM